jgi:hypothetical protein
VEQARRALRRGSYYEATVTATHRAGVNLDCYGARVWVPAERIGSHGSADPRDDLTVGDTVTVWIASHRRNDRGQVSIEGELHGVSARSRKDIDQEQYPTGQPLHATVVDVDGRQVTIELDNSRRVRVYGRHIGEGGVGDCRWYLQNGDAVEVIIDEVRDRGGRLVPSKARLTRKLDGAIPSRADQMRWMIGREYVATVATIDQDVVWLEVVPCFSTRVPVRFWPAAIVRPVLGQQIRVRVIDLVPSRSTGQLNLRVQILTGDWAGRAAGDRWAG